VPDSGGCHVISPEACRTASVGNSVISIGCRIEGTVTNSVLFPGVTVGRGAVVRDSVVMHDCDIGPDSKVDMAILDKYIHVGRGATVGDGTIRTGKNQRFPSAVFGGLTVVGKESVIPPDARIGANVIIGPGVKEADFRKLEICNGDTLGVA